MQALVTERTVRESLSLLVTNVLSQALPGRQDNVMQQSLPGNADFESGCQHAAPAIKNVYMNFGFPKYMGLKQFGSLRVL